MIKNVLLILSIFILIPVFAGNALNEVNKTDKVFLYVSANDCGYCAKFEPIFKKLSSNYSNRPCKFIKVDASTPEGKVVINDFGVYYLPYVIMIDNKKRMIHNVVPKCLLNYACINDATNRFIN